ncbi:FtsX-like permease family protein, partial [Thioclava sp. BHET1]
VDDAYPLVGAVGLSPAMPIAAALAVRDGLPGAVMEPVLAARLGLVPGDQFRLGAQSFTLRALLLREPDNAGAFRLGPRTLVARAALAQSGLLGPGTMYETAYRMLIPPGTDLDRLKAAAEAAFRDGGMRWADRRNAAPGIARFVGQIGDFLVLVGLAGLAVGGVGIAAAVRAYLDGKRATIATLRTLGARSGLIFRVYLLQIAVLVAIGVVLGLVLGAAAVLLAGPLIKA